MKGIVGGVLGDFCCVSLEIQGQHSRLFRCIGVHGQFADIAQAQAARLKIQGIWYTVIFVFVLLAVHARALTHSLPIGYVGMLELKDE
jgi:hypothetical protein